MKFTLITALLLFFSINNCSDQEKSSIEEFRYETSTRGSATTYTVTSSMIEVKRTGMDAMQNSKQISKEEWNLLLEKAAKIDASKMANLEAPSDSRANDSALMATLSVSKNDSIYKTNTFDHGNPPEMVKPLVEAILRLAENVE